ncbi:MAG TPA: hypothetical protein VK436_03555 [Methanocella sp.]|nr:hypothetical protein [Methanocella sp.]
MNTISIKSSKTNLEIDVPLTNMEMVLEIASLLCIIISLAVASVEPTSITLWTAIFPAIAIMMYLLVGYASRLPQHLRYFDGIVIDNSGHHQDMRETLALFRTEVVWTVLCIQGILAMTTSIEDPTARTMILAAFGTVWLLTNGALLVMMNKIPKAT